jgi:hypothetical protein
MTCTGRYCGRPVYFRDEWLMLSAVHAHDTAR